MRRPRLLTLFAAALVGLAAPAVGAAEEISAAERHVFLDRHLDGLPAEATLRYTYRRRAAGEPDAQDEAVLTARGADGTGRSARVDYLHGARRVTLPEVERALSNPVILHFLESDVRAMRRQLGAQENHFRRRIRLALADQAQLRPVSVMYGGASMAATEVLIRPYADDPQRERYRGMADKAYVFTLSPHVPGGVYELRTVVEDPAGGGPFLLEETLTLRAHQRTGDVPVPTTPGGTSS